jgi:hypothetical protein
MSESLAKIPVEDRKYLLSRFSITERPFLPDL